jgi:hypothetical protein
MKSNPFVIIAALVVAIALLLAVPVGGQENPRIPPPSQDGSPRVEQPSETAPQPSPNVQDQPAPSRAPIQPPSDVGVPGYPTRADTGVSWGIPLLTLLVGFAAGYFVGNSRSATSTDSRRDRAA